MLYSTVHESLAMHGSGSVSASREHVSSLQQQIILYIRLLQKKRKDDNKLQGTRPCKTSRDTLCSSLHTGMFNRKAEVCKMEPESEADEVTD